MIKIIELIGYNNKHPVNTYVMILFPAVIGIFFLTTTPSLAFCPSNLCGCGLDFSSSFSGTETRDAMRVAFPSNP